MRMSKEFWAMSILSDAQFFLRCVATKDELTKINEVNELINDAKRVLMGKYEEIEDGFEIRIKRKHENVDPESVEVA